MNNFLKIIFLLFCFYCPFIANADVGLSQAGSGYSSGYQSPKFETDNEITRYIEDQVWLINNDTKVNITDDGDIYINGQKVDDSNPAVKELKSKPDLLKKVQSYMHVDTDIPVHMSVNDYFSKITNSIQSKFLGKTQSVGASISEAGKKLLFALCLITFIWNGAQLMIKGTDFGSLFFELFRTIMIFGFFYWLLNNVPTLLSNMCAKFGNWGNSIAGNGAQSDVIASIVQKTSNLASELCFGSKDSQKSFTSINLFGLFYIVQRFLVGVFILFFGYIMAINLFMLKVEFICTAWLGVFILGMAGSPWTKDSSMTYLRTLLAKSVKYFISIIVISIGFEIIYQTNIMCIEGINKKDYGALCALVFACIIVGKLVMVLPNQIAGFIANPGQSEIMSPNKAGAMAVAGTVGAVALTGGLAGGAVASSALAKAGAMTAKQVGSNMLRKGVGNSFDGVSFRQNYHQANEAKKKMKNMIKS